MGRSGTASVEVGPMFDASRPTPSSSWRAEPGIAVTRGGYRLWREQPALPGVDHRVVLP